MPRLVLILVGIVTAASLAAAQESTDLAENAKKLFFTGRLTPSAESYQRALVHNPALQIYLDAAIVYKALGKVKEAVDLLEKAALLDPSNADIHSEIGWCYLQSARPEKAVNAFNASLAQKSDHPSALLGLGAAQVDEKNADDAIQKLRALKKKRPNFAAADFLIGRACDKAGDSKNAHESYVNALKRDWTFNEARVYLAQASQKVGKIDQAIAQLQSLNASDPQNPEIKSSLQALRVPAPDVEEEEKTEQTLVAASTEQAKIGSIESLKDSKSGIALRAGIWTSPAGRAARIKTFTFSSSGAFKIIGKKSKKIYGHADGGVKVTVKIAKPGHFILKSKAGDFGPFNGAVRLEPESDANSFLFESVTLARGFRPENSPKEYRGILEVAPRTGGGVYLINEIDLEEYLLGCVPAEIPSSFPIESQKAQAVIARTQALLRKKSFRPHRKSGYDLCDSQHCQVYKGVRAESAMSRRAVLETKGELLTYNGKLAHSYYSSNCGGHSRASTDLKGWGSSSYLRGVADGDVELSAMPDSPWKLQMWIRGEPDANCNLREGVTSTEFRWLRIVPTSVAERRINRKCRVGKIVRIVPLARGASGHIKELLIEGKRRKVILRKENDIRSCMTIGSLRSTLFFIEEKRDAAGNIKEFWISGGGWGHGVGLCQSGAGGLASKFGKTYDKILEFYYPGTGVTKGETQ